MALKLACVFLASGHSTRFKGNKLLADCGGRSLADVVFNNHPCELFNRTVVVTRYAPVAVSAAEHGFTIAENDDPTGDIAVTIRLGIEALGAEIDGAMFSVCDQPLLTPESINRLADAFRANPKRIAALGYQGKRGNPVIFPRTLFGELKSLSPNQSGSTVIEAHYGLLDIIEVSNRRELLDVDYQSDLEELKKN